MNKYKYVHLWLILAFIVVLLGFLRGYWSNFAEESLEHHLHMFSALVWFGLLMAQPWLATRGHMKQHRRNGMIGLKRSRLENGPIVGEHLSLAKDAFDLRQVHHATLVEGES